MAREVDITEADMVFIGCDRILDFEVLNSAGNAAVDIAGFAIVFDLRDKDASTTARLTKSATITGTYNSSPGTNTQRARVTIADTDLAWTGIKEKDYRYSLKRTDDGSEDIYCFGTFHLRKATAA